MAASGSSTDWLVDGLSNVPTSTKEKLHDMQMDELIKLSEEELESSFGIGNEADRLTVLQRIQVASKQRKVADEEQTAGTCSHELLYCTASCTFSCYERK
eukprot:m.673329 g.673329  ORF g.673329 m.673329 type:complete len:100 (-) comp22782_c0_seq2:234-533(-)